MRLIRRSHLVAFTAILLLFVVARLWGLTASCLWFDEIFSVHAAEHDWSALWSFVALDLIHPPLFYAVLKLWISIGGESLLWLRLLPVLFSVIAIYPFLRLCSELFLGLRIWTTLLAFFFFAVNGSLIKYSQEVRMYSMLLCLSLFSFWLCLRYLRGSVGLMALTVVNMLMVWTHYFGWLVVLAELSVMLALYRPRWKEMLGSAAAAAILFLPWLLAVVRAAGEGEGLAQNIGWMSRPGFIPITQLKLAVVEPFYYQASSIDPFSVFRVSVPLLLIFGAAMVLWLIRWRQHEGSEREAFIIAAIIAGVPAICAFVLSWLLPVSVWGTRHLIIVFAPSAILLSLTVSRIPFSQLRIAAITLILLLTGYAFVLRATRPPTEYIWCAWEQLAAKLDKGSETHIYAGEDVIAYHLWFALRHEPNFEVIKLEAGVPEDKAYFLPRGFDGVRRVRPDGITDEHFWLACRTGAGDGTELPPQLSNLFVVERSFGMDLQNTRAKLVLVRRR